MQAEVAHAGGVGEPAHAACDHIGPGHRNRQDRGVRRLVEHAADVVLLRGRVGKGHNGGAAVAGAAVVFNNVAQVPLAEGPCPSCTALIDMWEGTMPHFEGLGGNLAVVAKAPIERVAAFARDKGWKHIRLLSAANSTFKRDYHGEDADGQQAPIMTVFKRWPDGAIRLHWASELLFEPADPGQDMRHMGTVEPLWTLFDLAPGGRPNADEQIEYGCCHSPAKG